MIVPVSLIVYIAKETSCFHYFSHGVSLRHHASIQLNDFYTCYIFLAIFSASAGLFPPTGSPTALASSCHEGSPNLL